MNKQRITAAYCQLSIGLATSLLAMLRRTSLPPGEIPTVYFIHSDWLVERRRQVLTGNHVIYETLRHH